MGETMNSINRVLVPMDFSECSRAALAFAGARNEEWGAQLDVLHSIFVPAPVQPGITGWVDVGAPKLPSKQETQARMRALISGIPELDPDCLNYLVAHGKPERAALALLEEGDYDLVVVGTHGRTGISRLLFGIVAEELVRHAPCPVITLRHSEIPPAVGASDRELEAVAH